MATVGRQRAGELAHSVFLARVADLPAVAAQARLGQGAFLVLRLVDLLRPDESAVSPAVFRYQQAATERYCIELAPDSPEAAHLLGLVRTADKAFRADDTALIGPALFAYAHHLEEDAHYDEALDVLHTMFDVCGPSLPEADTITGTLRVARVNRKLARFDEAESAYVEAGRRALAAGDHHSALLSRIGRANILFNRGNLAEAEQSYRAVLRDAAARADRDAEARAEHGLGSTLEHRGMRLEALEHTWRAVERYDDPASRLRALSDLGILLRNLGHPDAAEAAFLYVMRHTPNTEQHLNPALELLECASRRDDRIGFERWRAECHSLEPHMAPDMRAGFYLKQGVGDARFRQFRRAHDELRHALDLAEAAGLHEYVFRIERIIDGLHDCEVELDCSPLDGAEPVTAQALDDVRSSLHQLVAGER